MAKTILITGASSGFGKLSAKKFQQEGWNVIPTMRSPEKETEFQNQNNVFLAKLDVTDQQSIDSAVTAGYDHFGSIDVLLNNAGYGSLGPLEAATVTNIRNQFDANVLGVINVTRSVLPIMRKQKSGLIINMSSISGLIAFPYTSIYSASKFAIEGLTDALQYELNPLGIQLKLIEPGTFKTDFGTRSLMKFDTEPFPDYNRRFEDYFSLLSNHNHNSGDPNDVVEVIYEAATDGSDKFRYLVGHDAVKFKQVRDKTDDGSFKNIIRHIMGL